MKYRVLSSCSVCMYTVVWSFVVVFVEVFLYVHRNRRFIRDGSPGRPPRLSHGSSELHVVSTYFNVLIATILSLQVLESAKHLKRQPVNPTHPPVCPAVQWATIVKEMLVNVNDDRTIPMINPGQYNWTCFSQWSIQGTGFAGLYLFFITENANSLPSFSVLTESYSCIYADLSKSTVKWHLKNLVCWTLIMKLVQDERLTRDRKVVDSIPCKSGRRIFFSRVYFLCWLLFGIRSSPMLPQ